MHLVSVQKGKATKTGNDNTFACITWTISSNLFPIRTRCFYYFTRDSSVENDKVPVSKATNALLHRKSSFFYQALYCFQCLILCCRFQYTKDSAEVDLNHDPLPLTPQFPLVAFIHSVSPEQTTYENFLASNDEVFLNFTAKLTK